MDKIYPSLMKLWKEWNVRGTVLLSLTLQVVLIVLGNRRKHDSKFWIKIVIWCAYLSADYVATFALGVIANNMSDFYRKNGGSMDANTELTAFWTPFLLMHLGGPDTITAYSLEDNELWLRHFLGLLMQMGMASYVSFMAWTGSLLSFLSLLMFFAGLIEYGERTCVLRKASVEEIRESYAGVNYSQVSSTFNDFENSGGHKLFGAYCLMDLCFQPLFLDLNIIKIFDHWFQKLSVEDTFRVIEMSLVFMYSNLYTKAFLLYTHVGVGLKVISAILTSSVSVLFSVLIHKHKFSKVDVTITFILLFGATTLEIYSTLLLLFSDRFQVWLIKHKITFLDRFQIWLIKHKTCLIMFESFKRVLPKKKRWSNKMSQLSLLGINLKEKPFPCPNFLRHFRIVEKLENQWYAADIEIPNDLKKLILTYLKTKRNQINPSESDSEIPNDANQTAPSESLSIDVRGMDFTEELEKSILSWHVATEKWYEMDREDVKGKEHVIEPICQISRYLFSLLVLQPNMLSNANKTTVTIQPALVAARGSSFASRIEACQKILELLKNTVSENQYFTKNLEGYDENIPRFFTRVLPEFVEKLGEQPSWEERWMIISCTWLEMLPYAAAYKCKGSQHAQRLTCGGEFLTHVWLLTNCFLFTDKDFTSHAPRWASSILGFGEPC